MFIRALPALLLSFAVVAQAADPEVIRLWPERTGSASTETIVERGIDGKVDRAITSVTDPTLTVFLPENPSGAMPAVLVCPGGAYRHLAFDKEGLEVGEWLASIGVAAFVLKYRLPFGPGTGFTPAEQRQAYGDRDSGMRHLAVAVEDAERSMRLIRERAGEWGVNPQAVGVMGFSAGGHLAALLATGADDSVRPDFIALIYTATPQVVEFAGAVPPAFIAHANNDEGVSTDNSLRYYTATRDAGVPAELHIYMNGGHGFGIYKATGPVGDWTDRMESWLKGMGILKN